MRACYQPDRRLRAPAAAAALAAQAGLAYLLVSGLAPRFVTEISRRMEVIALPLPSPSPTPMPSAPPREQPRADEPAPREAAGAPGRRGKATQVVAPKPPIV